MVWWLWLIVAVALLAGELMTAGFFLFWFAAGALGATLTALFVESLPIQIAVFIVISAVLLFFSRHLGEKMGKGKTDTKTNTNALIGKTGMITQAVRPHQKGVVKVNGEEWSCVTDGDISIDVGVLVKVESLQGVTLTVVPADERKVG